MKKLISSNFGLFFHTVYSITFILLLIFISLNYKGYSMISFWISDLGSQSSPYCRIFNLSLFVFGLSNIFLIRYLNNIFENAFFLKLTKIFISLLCIGSIGAGIFPNDKYKTIHENFGSILFFGVWGAAFTFLHPIFISKIIRKSISILNITTMIFIIPFTISKINEDNSEMFLVRVKGFWEWSILFLGVSFSLVITSFIWKKLYLERKD